MRTIRRIALTVAATAAAGGAVAAAQASGPPAPDRLRDIEQARLHALVAGDTATAGRYMAPDFQGINPAGAPTSRAENLGPVATGDLDFLAINPTGRIVVRRSGSSAALRYPAHFDLTVGGTRVTHEAWVTELYERRAGRWLIVWEQVTAVPNDFGLFVRSIQPPS